MKLKIEVNDCIRLPTQLDFLFDIEIDNEPRVVKCDFVQNSNEFYLSKYDISEESVFLNDEIMEEINEFMKFYRLLKSLEEGDKPPRIYEINKEINWRRL